MCPSAQTWFSGRKKSQHRTAHKQHSLLRGRHRSGVQLYTKFRLGRGGGRKHKREKKERWFWVDFLWKHLKWLEWRLPSWGCLRINVSAGFNKKLPLTVSWPAKHTQTAHLAFGDAVVLDMGWTQHHGCVSGHVWRCSRQTWVPGGENDDPWRAPWSLGLRGKRNIRRRLLNCAIVGNICTHNCITLTKCYTYWTIGKYVFMYVTDQHSTLADNTVLQ